MLELNILKIKNFCTIAINSIMSVWLTYILIDKVVGFVVAIGLVTDKSTHDSRIF